MLMITTSLLRKTLAYIGVTALGEQSVWALQNDKRIGKIYTYLKNKRMLICNGVDFIEEVLSDSETVVILPKPDHSTRK